MPNISPKINFYIRDILQHGDVMKIVLYTTLRTKPIDSPVL